MKTYRTIGLLAAILAVAMPFVPMLRSSESNNGIVEFLRLLDGPTPIATIVLAVLSIALQVLAVILLLANRKGAENFGARVAQGHAFIALFLSLAAIVGVGRDSEDVFDAWTRVWLGGRSSFAPLPILLLVQWACLRKYSASTQQIWRGVSVACVAFCAVLGLLVFAYDGNVRLFISPEVTFFNVGVLCHVLAIALIYASPRSAWLWSGIIGFVCLISGFILTNRYVDRNPFENVGSENDMPIGAVLYAGWYTAAPYLPIIAYALLCVAAIQLFRARGPSQDEPEFPQGGDRFE